MIVLVLRNQLRACMYLNLGSFAIMDHTVECKRTANMIERSPAFRNKGKPIATGLRKFGEKIMDAGNSLQVMYRKASYVFETFQTEVQVMLDRLELQFPDKSEFFRDRINKMVKVVSEFREKVVKAKESILDAENHRHGLEGDILDGLREAEKYIDGGDGHAVDLRRAQVELESTNSILNHLHNTANSLDVMIKVLREYEGNLLEVDSKLDDIFLVTKDDFNYLIKSLNDLHNTHKRFMRQDNRS